MSGTVEGGLKCAATNKAKFGSDYYRKIGAKGGSTPTQTPKGFAYSKAHGLGTHIEAGRKGGYISRRAPKQPETTTVYTPTSHTPLLKRILRIT